MTPQPSTTPCVRTRQTVAALTLVLTVAVVWAHAASPAFWRVSTQQEFLRGEVESLSVDADGQLLLGPETEVVHEASSPFLWTVVNADGGLLVGSGSDGRVTRVEPDGTATTLYEADELDVHAVAAAGDGAVYVGTSPDGAVLRVGADGERTPVFDPEEKYIWDLVLGDDGTLFVATGGAGRIYQVAPDGTASLRYDTQATHVMTLTFDAEGNLLAGTGAPGQVFRIDGDGRAFVLLDTEYDEVRAVRRSADGSLFVVGVSQTEGSQPAGATAPSGNSTPTPSVSVSTQVTAVVVADAAGGAPPPRSADQRPQGGGGAVYRIEPDGVWDIVWQSDADAPYDVALDVDGGFIVGTGNDGKIFHVTEEPRRVVLLARATAQQVTRFGTGTDGGRYYVTSNPGKLYRLAAARATEGTYLSAVRDAETVAAWGTIRWRARTPGGSVVQLFTRSGNTETPNDTWSRWSEAYGDAEGSQISSPKARYLQWKAVLRGDRPALLSVTTAYLPRNLRPEITDLRVHEPGTVFQKPFSSGDPPIAGLDQAVDALANGGAANNNPQPVTLGRRVYRNGLQTFVWTATDPNEDQLQYDVLYRLDTESTWHPLRRGVSETIFTWDTTSATDGTYRVRIEASDALSNSPGTALTGARESTPFDIDNSAPTIEVEPTRTEGGQTLVSFVVRDAHSPVQHAEYSFDAEHWQVLYPVDGIPDSRSERFEVSLDTDAVGRLVIRATDAMNNTATAAVP